MQVRPLVHIRMGSSVLVEMLHKAGHMVQLLGMQAQVQKAADIDVDIQQVLRHHIRSLLQLLVLK